MKRCRHKDVELAVWRVGGGDIKTWFTAASWEEPDARFCNTCHAWLPLGPSNDSDERVRAEIRAAEIADDVAELTEWCMYVRGGYGDEVARGYSCAESNMGKHSADWQSGYLARCIAGHKEQP